MRKKILIHSLIFSPDCVSTAYLYADIARKLDEEGNEVIVLTTTPHYNVVSESLNKQPLKWKVWGICKMSDFNGIKVIHIPQKKFGNTLLRLLGFIYWHTMAFIIGLMIRKIDIIISPSPPLTIGVINNWLAKFKKCKVVYNVQEIYPDILHRKKGLVLSILKRIEKYVYNRSTCVTTIDRVFYDTIVDRFDDPSKLHIIPNFVDTSIYNPQNGHPEILDQRIFPQTPSLKVMYAGNIGYAQDWEPLIDLARRTKNALIDYFVIGEGVMKSYLIQMKMKFGLDNIHILPYQPRNLMPSLLAYSDVQFIFMSSEMEMQGFPSKVYTIMACGKPLLVCSGEKTPIVKFLCDCNCGLIVSEKDKDRKVELMERWLVSQPRDRLGSMGKNGLEIIRKHYSKEVVTGEYVQLMETI